MRMRMRMRMRLRFENGLKTKKPQITLRLLK
jgi:hypothetical protein